MAFGIAPAAGIDNPNGDLIVSDTSPDTVSCVRFSPQALAPKNFLAATSWDGDVRVWDVDASGQTKAIGMTKHEGPALWCDWSHDGQVLYTSGCDKKCMAWHLATQQKMLIGTHDEPVRFVYHSQDSPSPCIVTGGWDRKLKYWDASGGGKMLASIDLPERVHAMHLRGRMLCVGLADRKILVYDMRNPQRAFMEKISQLRHQTRVVEVFPDQTGFIVANVEGRASFDHVNEADRKKDFTYKCFKNPSRGNLICAVNSISFHPSAPGTFTTCGGDGLCSFWNKDTREKLKDFQLKNPLTASHFSADGKIFAYASGYDWAKGASGFDPNMMKPYMLLHAVQDAEIRKRKADWVRK
eukprot:Plantae.Rhodophyta-Hildenbrandia_rubra.ctg9633.p1 GENE.Plantae.Rhodophyta-Hildenbrandia_rubra.ctg9633~~Plantae.Rhodophyta-Hildenbrandia_rubra.ctg9633.p1  ORF type:complete len:354 (+),score=53.70 Plantae.Rhodophyta-Hildenbrandia_rubra.ctg9633:134-1195(+)